MDLIDTHAHLDFADDLEKWFEGSKSASISKIISVGTSIKASKKAIEIAEEFSSIELEIFATCSIHPQEGKKEIQDLSFSHSIDSLKQLTLSSKKVVAIGECGLDYYLENDRRPETSGQEKKFQRELFINQVELARNLNLPLVIHCRNAWSDIFPILDSGNRQQATSPGVFHSWTGDWQAAKKALGLGFYISFSGIVTFKNAPNVAEVAKKAPLERILVETDSPFLSPEPFRGKTNEPKNVKLIVSFLATLRGLPPEKVAQATYENGKKLFKL